MMRSISLPLSAAMAIVVAAFVGTLTYSQSRLSSIDRRVMSIATNAAPSIAHLAEVRAQLLRIGGNLRLHASADALAKSDARTRMLDARGTLVSELAAYHSLPTSPGEDAAAAELVLQFGKLDDGIRRALDGEASGRDLSEVQANIDSFAALVQRLIDLNSAHLQSETAEIVTARRTAVVAAIVLGAIASGCAIAATVVVARLFRQRMELVAARRMLLEVRAAELDLFSGRVAHDLKGPLGTILLLAESGTRAETTDKSRSVFERIIQRVKRMNTMMDALLEFARAGAKPQENARASIRAVIEEVVEEVRPVAHDARVDLRLGSIDEASVACTPGAISVVLSNLVRNALKYIDGGIGRSVQVRTHRRHDQMVVEVEDTGRGLPPESEQLVFEPYVRISHEGPAGIGMGLATVKRLVESYGGAVGVRSKLGSGSCFWFSLPLAAVQEARTA
jgi:signal transduction histidine kinase